jgi:hypothetical protein
MTTATYHSTGLGQEAWGQPLHQGGFTLPQQYGSQQQPAGQQVLAILPALFVQQAQQLYALAQMCTQLTSGTGYQAGLSFAGQRPYPMGV